MSNENANIVDNKFNTYGQALAYLLDIRGVEQKWVVEQIVEQGQKLSSLQSQLSRWIKDGKNPSRDYRLKINRVLSVYIHQQSDGYWYINQHRDTNAEQNLVAHESDKYEPINQAALKEIRHLSEQLANSGTGLDSFLDIVQSRANRLSQDLKELFDLIEVLKELTKKD